ncbi:MAG: hypothetical protein J3Q66DRAFT_426572 [Benniella sp.]|nr:MAG: hypothetical protein J3Q66DRAFT_426572 [Benniella sp.]
MLTAISQHPSPVPTTTTVLEFPCPNHVPCVPGQSAPLCDPCVQFVVDALNASHLRPDDFYTATLPHVASIHTQTPHQSPPPLIPVSSGPTSPDTDTSDTLPEETGSSSAVDMPVPITILNASLERLQKNLEALEQNVETTVVQSEWTKRLLTIHSSLLMASSRVLKDDEQQERASTHS